MTGIRRGRLAKKLVVVFCAAVVGLSAWPAHAQEVDVAADVEVAVTTDHIPAEKVHRPSFDFEQCANLCQLELDRTYAACDREAKVASVSEVEACGTATKDAYGKCLATCPPDLGE